MGAVRADRYRIGPVQAVHRADTVPVDFQKGQGPRTRIAAENRQGIVRKTGHVGVPVIRAYGYGIGLAQALNGAAVLHRPGKGQGPGGRVPAEKWPRSC